MKKPWTQLLEKFWAIFPDKIFSPMIPWFLLRSLTLPWHLWNSPTFPSLPDKWPPWFQFFDAVSPPRLKPAAANPTKDPSNGTQLGHLNINHLVIVAVAMTVIHIQIYLHSVMCDRTT